MVAPIPEPIRAIIQHEFELGYCDDAIVAGPYSVSLRSVQRMRSCWRHYGTVFLSTGAVGGRSRALQDYHEYELLEYLRERPMAYLDELRYHLYDSFEILIDESTVWRTLRRLGWSRKRLRRIARQRNQQLRDGWFAKLSQWRADQLIFLDESAACERTGTSPPPLRRRLY